MNTSTLKFVVTLSWIYCLAYILFGFPQDTLPMRAVTAVMSIIFTCSMFYGLLKVVERGKLGRN